MTEQQVMEARERLNITVEGETSPTVPLEAFDDMVRSHSVISKAVVCLRQCLTPLCVSPCKFAAEADQMQQLGLPPG